MLQQAQMAALPNPDPHDLQTQQRWLFKRIESNPDTALQGPDSIVWGDLAAPGLAPTSKIPDLLALYPRPVQDPFTTLVAGKFSEWFYDKLWFRMRRLRNSPTEGVTVNTTIIRRVTSIVTTAVASLLPIGSIVVLYCVQTMRTKLAFITTFTFIFALSLACFTSASRSEVFAGTAA